MVGEIRNGVTTAPTSATHLAHASPTGRCCGERSHRRPTRHRQAADPPGLRLPKGGLLPPSSGPFPAVGYTWLDSLGSLLRPGYQN